MLLTLGVGNAWAEEVTWEKATSIAAGDEVLLVCESKKMELSGISTTSTKYGIGTAYTTNPAGAYVLTVEEGSSAETFSFKNGTTYLYWTSGNSLATNATKSANTSWKVTFSGTAPTIVNAKDNSRKLQWNASSPRFACYTTSQTAVQLYKKVISEESEDVIVKTLESIEVTPKTINYETGDVFKFDGTCTATYSVTKNGEPQDDETAVVTPTTVSTPDMSTVGTKEITVTYTEDDVTKEDKYEINVTENVVTPGTYTGNLNNVFFGCATGNNSVEQSGKFDDVLVVAGCTSSASSKTYYAAGHVRFYADSYLTLSVPVGYVIKSIVFTADGTWNGSITASAGTYDNNSKTWTGNAQEVKFSFAQQNRIKSVKVTYAADVKYALNITTPSKGTLVVKEGETEVTSGATFPEGTKLSVVADPAQGYKLDSVTVVDESSNDVTDDVYADGVLTMPAYNITISAAFSVNEKPAATLTLSKNDVEETFPGSWKQDDVVTLPSITSDCVKAFVGWSANDECAIEPEYKAGDEYTLESTTQTLYAVYATVGGGGEATASVNMATYATANSWGDTSSTNQKQITINSDVKAVISEGGNSGKYYNDGVRIYQSESATVTISTTVGELKSVKFTFTNSSDGTLLYGSTKLTSGTAVEVSGTSAVFSVSDTHATENKGQIRFTAIEVVYTGDVSYSNYSTTCAAALANPTFSLAEGKYTEAKSVEIEYTEGTVYYTMDGTEPTASSTRTQYTGAIALNDCGEYTIKAIAISADSQSDVVSATYTIKLPLTNSQSAPYTETEAIAVYDGDCYDNQDVYVKGTVKTATFYSSGTYTITLTNGFQFYKFYKDGSKTLFADGEINKGDVLVACGKLSKYNTTYQLAEGCYLVEHEPYTEPKTDISNTEATAYTVDQAFALIANPSSDLTKEVYVKGLVAVAPTSNPTADGQMTYKISDNGENTGNVLTVYLGLNLNGEKFTSKNDVQQGDYVVVKGKLLDYNSTYELNKGNQLVQHLKAATISIADITMEVGETKTIAATINPDAAKTEVAYSIKAGSDDCITLSENNITAKAEGTATIVATIATAAEYMGKTVEFKVTVTPVNIATLPFSFDGGAGDIATTLGMSQKDLGNDYGTSPKLKFDNTDDNVIIHFDSEPVELSFTLKQNGSTVATYTVYESEDGNTYSPIWVAGEIGNTHTQDVTVTLSDAARYVKFEYTNKITGTNYALGKISITNTYSEPTTLSGKFSTGKYEYAEFATGNLQYKKEGENETWRFAKQQYQVVGEDNIYVGKTDYEGWIDMFGWSNGDANNFGVNASNDNKYYTGTFVDWGTKMGEGWSTLSKEQWDYLLNTRDASLKQIAKVGDMLGIMLFPDEWTLPAGCEPVNTLNHDPEDGENTKYDFYSQNYTLAQWTELEKAGAVFLPAAGRRTGGWGNETISPHMQGILGLDSDGHYKYHDNTNYHAYYWTSTYRESDNTATYLHNIKFFGNNDATVGQASLANEQGRYGQSVRLAKVTSTLIEIGGGDNSAVIADNAGKTVNVKLDRPFNTSGWGTLCVPFEMSASLIGEAYKLGTITKHQTGEGINLNLAKVDTIEAGKPYLIKANVLSLDVIKNVTIVNTIGSSYTVTGDGIKITFTGLINGDGQTNGSTEYYVGAHDGYLYNAKVDKLGLRALFTITDEAGNPTKVRARVVVGENTTTGFENITNGENTTIKVIENGQLIIIRDGVKFNAQGVRL